MRTAFIFFRQGLHALVRAFGFLLVLMNEPGSHGRIVP